MSKEYDDIKQLMPYIHQVHYGHIKPIMRDCLPSLVVGKIKTMLEKDMPEEVIIKYIADYITAYIEGYIGGGIQTAQKMKWLHYTASEISDITDIDQKLIMEIDPLEPENTP